MTVVLRSHSTHHLCVIHRVNEILIIVIDIWSPGTSIKFIRVHNATEKLESVNVEKLDIQQIKLKLWLILNSKFAGYRNLHSVLLVTVMDAVNARKKVVCVTLIIKCFVIVIHPVWPITCRCSNVICTLKYPIRKMNLLDDYRSGTVNSNTVNSKFHLIRSYCKYLATILSFHV